MMKSAKQRGTTSMAEHPPQTPSERGEHEDQPLVIEPFDRDGAPHLITIGRNRSGSTVGMQRRRFAEIFENTESGETTGDNQ
jgi:hypothetical protein